jgi:tetraacyldisaccharide 4'-kinase
VIGAFLRSRRQAARNDPHTARLSRPVISIGNISMGGRGKTPLTALVARLLVEAGEKPAILSRGYGRAIADAGVTVVSDGSAVLSDLAHSGDEPLMLARAVPGAAVVVCEQRSLAGTLAESALGCTVHILDDGFQHHQLHRDLDIVLVTAEDFSARVMPFGKLREPVESLQDADAILSDGVERWADGSGAMGVGQWGNWVLRFAGSAARTAVGPHR